MWKPLSCLWLLVTPWTIGWWNSSGQNTGVGSLFILQGIFPNQVCCIAGEFFTNWAIREAQITRGKIIKSFYWLLTNKCKMPFRITRNRKMINVIYIYFPIYILNKWRLSLFFKVIMLAKSHIVYLNLTILSLKIILGRLIEMLSNLGIKNRMFPCSLSSSSK